MNIIKKITQQPGIPFATLATCLSFMFFFIACFNEPEPEDAKNMDHEIIVHTGNVENAVRFFKSKDFWGENFNKADLDVPRVIIVATSKRWDKESQKVPVEVKKEIFYRALVPKVLLANELILEERQQIETIEKSLKKGKMLTATEQKYLQSIATKYEVEDLADHKQQINDLLNRVDIIPPSLALGQSAYESGYGTSRFAIEGNAMFGQWTYSGTGMKPKEHRKSKGDYGVAAYRWLFDSVRSYMLNLNTHRAYQELRDRRAELRKQGKKNTGLALAETLGSYSERGMEYIKTLKSIITDNDLAATDNFYLRDEPLTLIVAVANDEQVKETEAKIEKVRASGELERIIKEMRLDGGE